MADTRAIQIKPFAALNQTVAMLLGGAALTLAMLLGVWSIEPAEVVDWSLDILGPGFLALLSGLVLSSVYCLVRLVAARDKDTEAEFWVGTGLQFANGISTLALTFTLLGISVGIGALADQGLTPETVQDVIRNLTASFSLAFMTTVIGLPLSALLRGALIVTYAHHARRVP